MAWVLKALPAVLSSLGPPIIRQRRACWRRFLGSGHCAVSFSLLCVAEVGTQERVKNVSDTFLSVF